MENGNVRKQNKSGIEKLLGEYDNAEADLCIKKRKE